MIAKNLPLFDHDATTASIEEQLMFGEGQDDPFDVDPRLSGMSDVTRAVVEQRFSGDVDEAEYQAMRLSNCYRVPAAWVTELVGKVRAGWKDLNRTRC